MAKTVIFEEREETLIQKIEKFAAEKSIPFDEAVKVLCEMACSGQTWGDF